MSRKSPKAMIEATFRCVAHHCFETVIYVHTTATLNYVT
jgi:hypothetical protein